MKIKPGEDKIVLQLQKGELALIEDTIKDGWKITPQKIMEVRNNLRKKNYVKYYIIFMAGFQGRTGGGVTTYHKIQLDKRGDASTSGATRVYTWIQRRQVHHYLSSPVTGHRIREFICKT